VRTSILRTPVYTLREGVRLVLFTRPQLTLSLWQLRNPSVGDGTTGQPGPDKEPAAGDPL